MKRLIAVALLVGVGALVVTVNPATADHDQVFAPCDPADDRPTGEQVFYIDYQSGEMLRFDNPWWGQRPGFGRYTNWQHQCLLGMAGVWQAAPILPLPHPPSYVTETRYDLFTAEYDGWPFEQTIILLEDRYPPGTPDRFHFRLSVAVEFLRAGGMIGGLDFLWGSGG